MTEHYQHIIGHRLSSRLAAGTISTIQSKPTKQGTPKQSIAEFKLVTPQKDVNCEIEAKHGPAEDIARK